MPIPALLLPRSVESFVARHFTSACAIAFSCLIFVTIWATFQKPLWFDEINTVLLSRLSARQLWIALSSAADGNPPVLYLMVRLLSRFIPNAELASRIPPVGCFVVMTVALYWIAKPYLGRQFAIAAALLPLITFASTYIVESRPYASTLALSGVSMLLWRQAIMGGRRTLSLAGLSLALALAVSTHYAATLIIFALSVGEAVRTILTKRIDFAVWLAIALGGLPLLFFGPLLAAVKLYLAGFWTHATLHSVYTDARRGIVQMKGAYLLVIVLAAAFLRRDAPATNGLPRMPAYECAAWLVFLCAPVEGYIQSKFTGGFTMRYAMPMVLPFGLLIARICSRASRGSSLVALILVAVSTVAGIANLRSSVRSSPAFYRIFNSSLMPFLPPGEKLLIGSPLFFTSMYYYSREPLRSRLCFIPDPDLERKFLGTDSTDLNIRQLSVFSPMPTFEYAAFMQEHKPFALFVYVVDPFTWVDQKLAADAIPVKKLACIPMGCLYQVR